MATDPQLILEEKDRQKLDGIVSKMKANNEPDDKIRFVVNDFKSKYGVKKKDKSQDLAEALGAAQEAPSQEESGAGSPQESSDDQGPQPKTVAAESTGVASQRPLLQEEMGQATEPTNTERNPLVTAGKSFWKAAAYDIPASQAATGSMAVGSIKDVARLPEMSSKVFAIANRDATLQRQAKLEIEDISKMIGKYEKALAEKEITPEKFQEETAPLVQRVNFLTDNKFNDLVQTDPITQAQNAMLGWAIKRQDEGATLTEDLTDRLSEIGDPVDALNWMSSAVAQSVPHMAVAVLTRGAGSFGTEIGSIYSESVKAVADEQGISPEEVIERGLDDRASALAYGAAAGLLEKVGADQVMSSFTKQAMRQSLRRRALSGAIAEAPTEAAQTILEQVGVNESTGKPLDEIKWDEVLEAAAQGGVAGGGLSSLGGVRKKTREYRKDGEIINRSEARAAIESGNIESLEIKNDPILEDELIAQHRKNRKKTIKDEKETPTTEDATKSAEPVQPERKPAERIDAGGTTERNIVPEGEKSKVASVINKRVKYDGKPGYLYREGERIEFETDEGVIYELGPAEEVLNKPVSEHKIDTEDIEFGYNKDGSFSIRNKNYHNNYSDPESAINYDKDGEVSSVTLETEDGAKRNFRGQLAEDIAYEIRMSQINEEAFNQYLEENEEAGKTINEYEEEVRSASIKEEVGDHKKLQKSQTEVDLTEEEGDIIFKKPITSDEQVETKKEVPESPEVEGEAIQAEVIPTAKEEEAEKITIKEKGKQLADRIRTLKIQQEKGVLKSDFTGGLAPAIWNDVVVEGVAQAVEAGATIVEAVDNVVRDLKGKGEKFDEKKLREYWGALPERKGKKEVQAKAEFEAQFQKDISSRETRVKEEKEFKQGMKDLRDQIRLEARAAREGFKAARTEAREQAKVKREEKSDFAQRVAEKIKPLKGRLKASQTKSILNRANKINVSNPKAVANYIDYVGKVTNDANYDQKLTQGKKLQGLARKAFKAKSTLVNHKEALDAIRKVPVNKVSDIDEYNRVIGEYLRSFRPVSQGQYQMGNPDAVLDYLGKQRTEIDKAHAERLLEEYEMTVEDFGGKLSAKDILEMIESDKEFDKYAENLDRAKKIAMSDALTNIAEYSQMGLNDVSTEEMTEADKQDLSKLKDIDTSRLSDNQKKEFIKVVDNVIVNNSFAGSGQIMEAYDAIKGMDEALAARGLIDRVRQLYKLTGKVESLPMMFRTMFGLNDARILIEKAMGQTRFFQAVKAWKDEYQGILDKYKEVTNEARKMDKDAFSAESIYARGMVSNVVQSIPGDDMGNQFADWKPIIDESIDKKSKNRDFKDEAATERIIYDKIIKDASNPADVIRNFKREYLGSHLVWDFFTKEVHPGYRQRLARNAENFFNQQWEDWNFYNARKYKQYRGADKDIQEEDTFGRLSLSPKQSPHSIRRSRYSSLPADMVLDFDFDKNQLNAVYKNLYDIHTAAPKAQINNFMKLPDAVQIFDTINNIDIVKKKFDDVYKTLGRQGFVDDAMQQALRRVTSTIRRYAISRALGGFYQLVKQPVSVMFNTAINNNLDIRVMGSGLAQLKRASAIHNMFSIGERGKTRGGTKMADIDDKGGISAKNSMLRRLGVILDYLSEAFLKPLTIADTIAARGSWNIYYLKYLKEKGYDISSIDMAQEASNVLSDPTRLAAAQYAESSIDINQVASEMSKIAEVTKTQANVYQNIFRDIFIPFSSFSVEARGRIINDWMDIWAGRNRAQAGKSQVATLGEIVIFNAIKVYMLSWVTQQGIGLLYSMFGIEDEDKSEEEKKAQLAFEFKKFYSSIFRDMFFSGFGQLGENGGMDLINGFAYWAGRIGDMDFVKKKNGDFMTYKGWLKENKMPLYRYDAGQLLGSLGLLDVVVNQVTDFGSQMEVLHESDKLSDEQRRLVYFATLAQILQTADMMDVDLYRITQRAQDEMLRENKKRGGGRGGSGTGSSGYGEFDFDLDFANDF